jgi:hypothetical protein
MTKYPAGNVKRPPPGRASRAGDNRRGAFKVRSHSPSPVRIHERGVVPEWFTVRARRAVDNHPGTSTDDARGVSHHWVRTRTVTVPSSVTPPMVARRHRTV